ncbi:MULTISPECIES: site-specific integrase [Paraburkholderia]|uniref:site-specific integrase n=1 Tax=Paraburkholderia TaxID=1822464 RepID=UPI0022565590|nr:MULTISPECIES: site-specific integrase [Paraburkholderia]MCX4164010.1 site-specific integrase [Paraburkholderia megapolitana]MDN7159505.1 site-specific integrase [Paraburkholderia sp. CHISQ3]MDQ6496552.1 site-specific integrase [Paraburkholderia megapolitana]
MKMEYRLVLIDPRKLPSMSDHELGLFSGAGSFNLLGRPKVGVILAGDADFQWECTEFLADACLRSSSWTGDTVRVYGEGMVAWMQFLAAEELSLSDATEEDLLGFRAALRRRRAHGIWDLSPATIRLRLVAVMQFYRWAQRGRIFASPLGEWLLADNDASGASSFRGRRYRVALADSYLPRVRSRLPAHC